jgi:intracellular septation protein
MSPAIKLLVEAGPLLIFFAANAYSGIFWATGLFMVASLFALGYSRIKMESFALVPLIGAIFVGVFGILTLWLHDDIFIKIKVTLVNGLFGAILLAGIVMQRPFLKQVLGESLELDDAGWHKLTVRWMVFFFFVAGLNEFIWRNFETDFWVNFKVFGLLPITIIFALAQMPLMQKHSTSSE